MKRKSDWIAGALVAVLAVPAVAESGDRSGEVRQWLQAYDAAFNAKDLDRLAAFYDPDVTIFEGGGVNSGWVDYRDNHLGKELQEFESLQFSHGDVVPRFLDKEGRTAYVTSQYRLKVRVLGKDIDAQGLETLILVTGPDEKWKIRHSHTSSRRRPAGSPQPPSR